MFHITRDRSLYLSIFLTMTARLILSSADDGAKISDACHGQNFFNQTHNILKCDEGTQICITQVRYYQWHETDQVCPVRISSSVPSRCCRHKAERCSWTRGVNDRQELQRNCTGQSNCVLYSSDSEQIAAPCVLCPHLSRFSSVRSIIYTCTSSGTTCSQIDTTTLSTSRSEEALSTKTPSTTCPPHPTTTIPSGRNEESSSTKASTSSLTDRGSTGAQTTSSEMPSPNNSLVLDRTTNDMVHSTGETTDIGAVVGGVIGGLVTCAVIVAVLVFLWKRRSLEKPRVHQSNSRGDDVTEVQIDSGPNDAYEGKDNNTRWNRGTETNVSDLYSQVNKTRRAVDSPGDTAFSVGTAVIASNHHGNYDRVQGEAAHFTVHGDYDHVIRRAYGDSGSDDVTGRVTENADVDMTYDRLHHGRAVPARTEIEVDPYDVLNRANTRTT